MPRKKVSNPIPDLELVKTAAAPDTSDATESLEMIGAHAITTHADLEISVSMIAEVKTKMEEIDSKRRSFVDPLRSVVDEINAFFSPALDALGNAEKILKNKISGYVTDSLIERDNLLAVVAEAPQDSRSDIIKRADDLIPPKISGLSVREVWGGEVVDADELVSYAVENNRLDLLTVDPKALHAITKALGRDPRIPGWKAYQKRTIAITASKVKPLD